VIGFSGENAVVMPFGGLEGVSALVDEKLLDAYRAAFLQVVNLSYLRQISEGKLPRGSRAAIALLNSVDVEKSAKFGPKTK
jgi:hypothetical protein